MLKGKNQDGQHIEFDSDESDIDEKEYRRELKTQNQTIVTMQRSIEANVTSIAIVESRPSEVRTPFVRCSETK